MFVVVNISGVHVFRCKHIRGARVCCVVLNISGVDVCGFKNIRGAWLWL